MTFDVYSKKKEKTSPFVLSFIYFYYTLLVFYVLNLLNQGVELAFQFGIFALLGAFVCSFYYNSSIKAADREYDAEL